MSRSDNETYNDYSVDSEDQPSGFGESLTDDRGLRDPMDEGYSPPERWSAGQGFGNTAYEAEIGESLDQRIKQEEPEPDPYDDSADGAEVDEDGLPAFAGGVRAGRLAEPDDRSGEDTESDLVGRDVGIDGAGASAEEAAMHIIEPGEDWTVD